MMVFKVNNSINDIRDFFMQKILYLKIWKGDVLVKSSVSYTIEGYDSYGFVALNKDQGPTDIVWVERGYSEIKVWLRHRSGNEILINLRGQRQTGCSIISMNSSATCEALNKYSKLIISFHPEDNENLKYESNGTYSGLIPLQARQWYGGTTENILVNVSLRDLISEFEPEVSIKED